MYKTYKQIESEIWQEKIILWPDRDWSTKAKIVKHQEFYQYNSLHEKAKGEKIYDPVNKCWKVIREKNQ